MIKSALVTGAGGGLGRAVALALAARGCAVAALDINGPAVEETGAEAGSGLVTPLVMDLTAPGAAELAVVESLEALGGLDIVVNNAGWGIGEAFLAMTEASWDRTLALNLKAVALICAAAGRHMKTRGSGRIVNVTSPASRMALPNYLAYAASKAGVDAVTRAAAVALAPFGVRVNSVAPGMMDTAMQGVTERQLAAIDGRDDIAAFLAERTSPDPDRTPHGCGDGGRHDRLAGVGRTGLHHGGTDERQRRPGPRLTDPRVVRASRRMPRRPPPCAWERATPRTGQCAIRPVCHVVHPPGQAGHDETFVRRNERPCDRPLQFGSATPGLRSGARRGRFAGRPARTPARAPIHARA